MRFTRPLSMLTGGVAAVALVAAAPVAQAGTTASAGAGALAALRHATAGGPQVVAAGLNNPRQLAFAASGTLYVAEAGRGGKISLGPGPEGPQYGGLSADVAAIASGTTAQLAPVQRLGRFPSAAGPKGKSAVGMDGVGVAEASGQLFAIETYAPPGVAPTGGAWDSLGHLVTLNPVNGRWSPVADVSAVEVNQNPDGGAIDSDPYSVLVLGPDRVLVADAAGNDIILVDHGVARPWAVLPDHDGGQAVPTVVAKGPDGTVLVGELSHFAPGTAHVYAFSRTGTLLGSIGGFTTVTGLAYDPASGLVFVSELFGGADGTGAIAVASPSGILGELPVPLPTGLAVRHGRLYASVFSVLPGNGTPSGQVWRLPLS